MVTVLQTETQAWLDSQVLIVWERVSILEYVTYFRPLS